jgi:hypothetical protein
MAVIYRWSSRLLRCERHPDERLTQVAQPAVPLVLDEGVQERDGRLARTGISRGAWLYASWG